MSVVSSSAILRSSITVTVAGTSLTSAGMRVAVTVIVDSCAAAGFFSCSSFAWTGNAAANVNMLTPSALNRPMLQNPFMLMQVILNRDVR